MKKTLVLLTLILVLVLVFVSCRGSEDTDEVGGNVEHSHSYGDWTVTVEPSCSTEGERVRTCECGAKEVESIDKEGHAFGEWVISGNPSCITSGTKERSCSCGEIEVLVVNATGHTMSGSSCSVCGATYSEGLEFVSNDNGTCYVKSIGSCKDEDLFIPPVSPDNDLVIGIANYAFDSCPVLKSVVIGANVETIESAAFYKCENLINVVISDSVTSIGASAFWRCHGLKSVTFGENSKLEKIENRAFEFCESLGAIEIPDSTTLIGFEAFKGCIKLEEVVIGDGVTTIESYAFTDCTDLKSVVLGKKVERIDDCAFYACESLAEITIPDSVTSIGASAFWRCHGLKSVAFGENSKLEKIEDRAFELCESLGAIEIPNSATLIGYNAFSRCKNLENVIIGKGVTKIGGYAFYECPYVIRLYYKGTIDEWNSIDIEDHQYPLNVTPYCYSKASPSKEGDYWYYDDDGNPKVWDVSYDVFKAEYYSNNFASIFCDDPSYASVFYDSLDDDIALQFAIKTWEIAHIVSDPAAVFDPENSIISKKDLYILTLHDLLMGNSANQSSNEYFEGFFAAMESAEMETMVAVAQALESYDDSQVNIDDIKDIIKNMSPDKAKNYLMSVCKNFSVEDVKTSVKKTYSVDGFEYFGSIVSMAENIYDAVVISSKYEAMRKVSVEYLDVVLSIKDDPYAPSDMRKAAEELYESYQDAFTKSLMAFRTKTFVDSTTHDVFQWVVSKTVDSLIGKIGILQYINFAGKGVVAICSMVDMDEFVQSYYMLETAVRVEESLIRMIKNPAKDYFRHDRRDAATAYMATVDLYETSVILGIEKSKELLTAYINSSVTSDEEMQQYNELLATLTENQHTTLDLYNQFEDLSIKCHDVYYS